MTPSFAGKKSRKRGEWAFHHEQSNFSSRRKELFFSSAHHRSNGKPPPSHAHSSPIECTFPLISPQIKLFPSPIPPSPKSKAPPPTSYTHSRNRQRKPSSADFIIPILFLTPSPSADRQSALWSASCSRRCAKDPDGCFRWRCASAPEPSALPARTSCGSGGYAPRAG